MGGLTPSTGLLGSIRSRVELPLHVLIRPRAGGFRFTADEHEVMLRDIAWAQDAGVQGVVLGVLTDQGEIDRERTASLGASWYSRDACQRLAACG